MNRPSAQFCYWLFDTRNIWDGQKIDDAAPGALSRLNDEEAQRARRFYFLKDAKLSVGSSLLKRLFASKTLGIPWSMAEFGRAIDKVHGKPCVILSSDPTNSQSLESQTQRSIDFNITHQAGLVGLAGFCTTGEAVVTSVGVDVVCVNERNDMKDVKTARDFDKWVDIYAEVFSQADIRAMKARLSPLTSDGSYLSTEELQDMTRRFYAFWALKEAYVKMEGEALLAKWLQHVEFRNVRIPAPHSVAAGAQLDTSDRWGETTTGIEAWFYGEKRANVEIFLQAFEQNYMIATAFVKDPQSQQQSTDNNASISPPEYQILDLQQDILTYAD